jgi:hypothetical protein
VKFLLKKGLNDMSNSIFDTDWYLKQYIDVKDSGLDAEYHYDTFGWQEGRDPSPFFDTSYYLANNSDVTAAGINPLDHYLAWGGLEGRDPSNHFDSDYYLAQNADVKAAGVNPLNHFLTFGSLEGRSPFSNFNAATYLAANPDVDTAITAGTMPSAIYHYAMHGVAEGLTGARISVPVISGTEETGETEETGMNFQLTTNDDSFTGTAANDHFYGIYDGVTFLAQNTFNSGDILDGAGGTDTLHIDHFEDVAIDLPDTLWTGISGIENIVMNTTGSGAHDIITGTNFNTAFASGGVDLSTTTTGAGAITINMDSFTGTAKLTANSAAGAIVLSGVKFSQIDVTTTGSGAQTITSTGANNVIVNATSSEGATSITTGAGDDTIHLHATSADGLNTITAGAGADTINLYTNFASIDKIVQADGDSMASTANTITSNIATGDTITFGNGLDIVRNFGVNDNIDVGTGGAAVSGLTMDKADFAATTTIFLSGTYAEDTFTIAADGGGTDTLLLDTTAVDDTDIATADTWILLSDVTSDALSAGSFV